MKFFRGRLLQIYLPLMALAIAVQAMAVVHEVHHDIWGNADHCPICSVASHSTAPTPAAPVIATVSTVALAAFVPTEQALLLTVSPVNHKHSRAPPAFLL